MVDPHDEEMRQRALSEWASSKYAEFVVSPKTKVVKSWRISEELPAADLSHGGRWHKSFMVNCLTKYKGELVTHQGPTGRLYSTRDLLNWEKIHDFREEGADYVYANPAMQFEGDLYIGYAAPPLGYGVLKYDGETAKMVDFAPDEVSSLEVYNGELVAGILRDSRVYSSSTPGDPGSWSELFDLADSTGGMAESTAGSALARYPPEDNLYILEESVLPTTPNFDAEAAAIHRWDGTDLSRQYTPPYGRGYQNAICSFRPRSFASESEPNFLYCGLSSGDIVRYDGTDWIVEASLPFCPSNINKGVVPTEGTYVTHQIEDQFLIFSGGISAQGDDLLGDTERFQAGGSLWATDGLGNWFRLLEVPNQSFWNVTSFRGKLLFGTQYSGDQSYAAISAIGLPLQDLKEHPPRRQYFMEVDGLWKSLSIDAGDTSYPIPCLGYKDKTVYFLSDTDGTLTVEVDAIGDGNWQTYTTESITADEYDTIPLTGEICYVRISFDTAATVTGQLVVT